MMDRHRFGAVVRAWPYIRIGPPRAAPDRHVCEGRIEGRRSGRDRPFGGHPDKAVTRPKPGRPPRSPLAAPPGRGAFEPCLSQDGITPTRAAVETLLVFNLATPAGGPAATADYKLR